MEGEEAPPLWHPPSALSRRRQRWPILHSSLVTIILPSLTLLFFFFILLPLIPRLNPQNNPKAPFSIRKSWDSLNIVLVVFAIFCGVFARWSDKVNPTLEERSVNVSVEKSEGQTSLGVREWGEYAEQRVSSPSSTEVSRLRRTVSEMPLSPSGWEAGNDRMRFYDDFDISNQTPSHFHHHHYQWIYPHVSTQSEPGNNWSEPDTDGDPITDPFVLDTAGELPRPTFSPPTNQRILRSIQRGETVPHAPPILSTPNHQMLNLICTNTSITTEALILHAPLLPPENVYQIRSILSEVREPHAPLPLPESYEIDGIPTVARESRAPLPLPESYEIKRIPTEARELYAPPPTPPPPPPLPPPSPHGGWGEIKKRSSSRKRMNATKEIAIAIASLYSHRKRKRKQKPKPDLEDTSPSSMEESPPTHPPLPPPPPSPSVFQNLFRKGSNPKSMKVHSLTSAPPPPPPLPPRPPNSVRKPESRQREMDGGDEKREREDDERGPTRVTCPSPDVNAKADTFIARHHSGWRLEKINSTTEEHNGPTPIL